MNRLRSACTLLIVFVLLLTAMGSALASGTVDLALLEESLKTGASSPKDVQTMLNNAWLNGYDHCKVSQSENADSFVVEIAVRGLVSPLRLLARSEDAQDVALLMQVRDTLLSQCQAVVAMLEEGGAKNLHFSFVLLDDAKVLENEYAQGAVIATITVTDGQPVRVESVFEAWNAPISDLLQAAATENGVGDESIVKLEPTYILNISSKKFHIPTCDSVAKTKEKNKKEFFGTRDELLNSGYSPCGSCHP